MAAALAVLLAPGADAQTTPQPNADGEYVVPADWPLRPAGVDAGQSFRLLFVTSNQRDATSTNIADYNTFVQTTAAGGHTSIRPYSSLFKVLASTSAVDARDNTDTNPSTDGAGEDIYWLNGVKVANNYADFYDGDWPKVSNLIPYRSESGAKNGAVEVWIGSDHRGSKVSNRWLGASQVRWTDTADVPFGRSVGFDEPGTRSKSLFAMSPVFVVETTKVPKNWPLKPAGLDTGDTFRLLFVTSTTDDPSSTDIATYNTFVQTAAASGHKSIQAYSSQFRVLGSTSAVSAKANTLSNKGTGERIYWLNGDKVADNYADFYDSTWDNFTWKTEAGTNARSSASVWTGTNDNGDSAGSAHFGGTSVRYVTPGDAAISVFGPTSQTDSSNQRSFYALSPVFEVGATDATPEADDSGPKVIAQGWTLKPRSLGPGEKFRLLFVTDGTRNATSTNIADYNTFVQNQAKATTAHAALRPLSDGVRVIGSTSTVDARDNADMTGAGTGIAIYWLDLNGDGSKVADDYNDFYDGSWDASPSLTANYRFADGTQGNNSNAIFTGSGNDGTATSNPLGASTVTVARANSAGTLDDEGKPATESHRFFGITQTLQVEGDAPEPSVEVGLDWPLTPDGLSVGDRFRLMFMTSRGRAATDPDIATYNTFVQNAAGTDTRRFGPMRASSWHWPPPMMWTPATIPRPLAPGCPSSGSAPPKSPMTTPTSTTAVGTTVGPIPSRAPSSV